ncbi:MAG TPA: MFS transporter, partial [Polyangiaceae bacterium]
MRALTMTATMENDAGPRRVRTAAYYLGYVCIGLMDSSLGPTLGWLAAHASTTAESAGVLIAARCTGYVLGAVVAGRFFDRLPGHRIMAAGLVCTAGAFAQVPGFASLGALVVAFAFAGAGAGAVDVGGNTLLAWTYGDRVGPYLNGLHFFFGVGSAVTPFFVGAAFARGVDLAWVYWTIAALFAILGVFVAALPSPPRRVVSAAEAGAPLRHGRLIALVALSLMAYVGIELGFGSWIFTYATSRRSMSDAHGSYLNSVYWAAFTLGRLASIPAIAQLTHGYEARASKVAAPARALRSVLEAAQIGAAIALAILFVSHESATLWIGSALLGLSIGPIFPTLIGVAEQRLKLSGPLTSIFLAGGGIGGIAIPWFIGKAMQKFGTGAM